MYKLVVNYGGKEECFEYKSPDEPISNVFKNYDNISFRNT